MGNCFSAMQGFVGNPGAASNRIPSGMGNKKIIEEEKPKSKSKQQNYHQHKLNETLQSIVIPKNQNKLLDLNSKPVDKNLLEYKPGTINYHQPKLKYLQPIGSPFNKNPGNENANAKANNGPLGQNNYNGKYNTVPIHEQSMDYINAQNDLQIIQKMQLDDFVQGDLNPKVEVQPKAEMKVEEIKDDSSIQEISKVSQDKMPEGGSDDSQSESGSEESEQSKMQIEIPKKQSKPQKKSSHHSQSEEQSESEESEGNPQSVKEAPKKPKHIQTSINYEYQEPPTQLVTEPLASELLILQSGSTEHIQNSEKFPYNRVGCLFMEFSKEENSHKSAYSGTGTVIGPRYVLTVSHNLSNHVWKRDYQLTSFKLGYRHYNERPEFEKEFKIKSFFHHRDQNLANLTKGNMNYDYAFLQLDTEEDLEEHYGFKYDFRPHENGNEDMVMINYPNGGLIEFKESKGAVMVQKDIIYHKLETSNGSSGAAVLKQENDEYVIIGTHTGKTKKAKSQAQSANVSGQDKIICGGGTKFTEQMFCELMQFMTSRDGHLDLKQKLIRHDGCALLAKALTGELKSLNLTNNMIDVQACSELVRSQWTNLTKLNLNNNQLGKAECFKVLMKAQWPNLQELLLTQNRIDAKCCEFLIQADFPNLALLNLGFNSIGNKGCQHLSKSSWHKLKKIFLFWNKIETDGCSHLSQANWTEITFIDLHENQIEPEACSFLAQAHWPLLKEINLGQNVIGDEGCRHLLNATWPELEKAHLWKNSITAQGCQQILKNKWNYLQYINLSENNIENPESFHDLLLQKHKNLDLVLR